MKVYNDLDVYEASQERLKFIFDNFDNIYISFSGGKDSGVMLNLVVDYIKKYNINRKIGLLIVDLEAQYQLTIDYVENTVNEYKEYFNLYWVCLPLNLRNSISNYNPFWCCWEQGKDWVRELPEDAITINNHEFDFYYERMEFEEFVPKFGDWYSRKYKGKTACLVGIRSDESLNRYRTIASDSKQTFKNKRYSTKINKDLYNFYPIYDWKTDDIWVYNGKFKKTYNELYDKFYYAGVELSKMRICQPYGDDQRIGLNLYKIIEPEVWQKLLLRVEGVNSGQLYCGTKFLGYKNIELPQGHTWKTYTKFLLKTLPEDVRNSYIKKFKTYIKYWYKTGSALDNNIIEELKQKQYLIFERGISNRGKKDKLAISFKNIPDNTDNIKNTKDLLSWKRMAMCIIKNDIMCKNLSFAQTKDDIFKKINRITTALKWSGDND